MQNPKDTFFVYINGVQYDEDFYDSYLGVNDLSIESLGDDFNHIKDSLLIVDRDRKEARYLYKYIEFVYSIRCLIIIPLVVCNYEDVWISHYVPEITRVYEGKTFELFRDITNNNVDIGSVIETLNELANSITDEMDTKIAAIIS